VRLDEQTTEIHSRARDAAAWTRYWARGALHSCPNAFSGNYADEIRAAWADFFGAQPSGARVLDIGTGNGALALVARDTSAERGCAFEIEAIDVAQIIPDAAAAAHGIATHGITFRGGVAAESTGYPDAWFDAISSQFALEYMRIGATLAELARVLKPGGDAMFVVHHANSMALVTTQRELESFDFLQHEVPLLVNARRFLQRLAGARNTDELKRLAADAETAAQARELNRMVALVVARSKEKPNAEFVGAIAVQIVTALQEIRSAGLNAGLERLRVLGEEMQAHRDRLRAIAHAAHTRSDILRLAQEIRDHGFTVEEPAELKVRGGDLIGWMVRASRV
jgi:ubiquinone/menaquinone biosynthesis C-methylase UbiE